MQIQQDRLWNPEHTQIYFYVGASLSLLVAGLAIWTEIYWLGVLPIAALLGLIYWVKPFWMLYSFVAVLPFAMEFEIGSLGQDLPSEPLLIGLAGMSVLWLVQNYHQQKKLLNNPIVWSLLLHIVWAYVCIAFSTDPIFSLKYALSKTWFVAGSFLASVWLIRTQVDLVRVLILLVVSTTLTIAIIQTEHSLYGFTFDSINKACNPIYRNHVIYGVFIVMVLPFVFVLRTLTSKLSIQRLLIDIALVLFFTGIYFTYTRGAWLALPTMVVVWVAIRYRLLRFLYPLAVVAFIAFFAYLADDNRYLKYAPDFETTIYHEDLSNHLSATLEGADMSTMERFHRWIAAFRLFKEHPWVGIGPNTFVDNYKPYTSTHFETYISDNEERSTVHNYFIYVLVEQGVFGFLIVVILVGAYFIWGEKRYHELENSLYKKIFMACLLCGASFWLNNLFSDLVEANKVAQLWFFTIAWMVVPFSEE